MNEKEVIIDEDCRFKLKHYQGSKGIIISLDYIDWDYAPPNYIDIDLDIDKQKAIEIINLFKEAFNID